METRVTTGTVVALACSAVLGFAAPQQTSPSTGAPPGAGATERERARQTETISGCVQQGATAKAFVLAPSPVSAPAAGAGAAGAHERQHTTWELLPDSKTDLSKMVGKRVEVTGMAVIGPTGTEPSRAPGNAGVTRFMVKTIRPTAGSC
jgi:hypothetical protein